MFQQISIIFHDTAYIIYNIYIYIYVYMYIYIYILSLLSTKFLAVEFASCHSADDVRHTTVLIGVTTHIGMNTQVYISSLNFQTKLPYSSMIV